MMKTALLKTFFVFFLIYCSLFSFGQEINIMSYNIRYDNDWDLENSWRLRKSDIVQVIQKQDANLIGIQEGLSQQIAYLDSCLFKYSYIGVGRENGKNQGEYCAIFYDSTLFQVLEQNTFWLSETPNQVSVGWDAALERICTYGIFMHKSSRQKMLVLNTHFDHVGGKARKKAAKLILQKIEELNKENDPVILMGDFNALADEKPIKIIKTQLRDALEISQEPYLGVLGTFNDFGKQKEEKRIDYFFVKGLKVQSFNIIHNPMKNQHFPSDHFPIIMRIKMNILEARSYQ